MLRYRGLYRDVARGRDGGAAGLRSGGTLHGPARPAHGDATVGLGM